MSSLKVKCSTGCIRLHPCFGVTGAAIDLFTGQVNDKQIEVVNE